MAIWQWNINFVSRRKLLACFSEIPLEFNDEMLVSLLRLERFSLEELKGSFDSILSRNTQAWMSAEVLSWGHEDENDVSVSVENSVIEEIGCRFDTRNIDVELLKWFIDFADKSDFLFVIDGNKANEKRVIEPKPSIVFEELDNSKAMLFSKDPKKFFEDKDYLESINSEIEGEFENCED